MRKLAIVAVAAVLLLAVPSGSQANSHEIPSGPEPGRSAPTDYEYAAKRTNNLTLLVRRSLQIYDANNDQISLSEPQIIYAETLVVQRLGSYQLDIGQAVDVPADLVAQFAASSQGLSEAQLAAWTKYALRADFTLTNIEPTNAAEHQAAAIQAKTNQDGGQDNGQAADSQDGDGGADWWWFGLLAVVLSGTWYIFRGPDQKS